MGRKYTEYMLRKGNTYENTETFRRCYDCVWNGSAYFIGRSNNRQHLFNYWPCFNGKPQDGVGMMVVDS